MPWPGLRPRFYVSLGTGLDVPTTSSPTADLRAELGFDLRSRVRFGAVVASRAPSVLYAPLEGTWMSGGSALASVGFDVGRGRPVWLSLGLGGHWFDIEATRSRANLGGLGTPVVVSGSSTSAGGIAASIGVSVPRRLSEWLVLEPYVLVQGGSYDPSDVADHARILVPVSLRLGFKVTGMKHVGAGVPRRP